MTDTPDTTDLTGLTGFTQAERRGVQRLADRLSFEVHVRRDEGPISHRELEEKRIALAVLTEMLT